MRAWAVIGILMCATVAEARDDVAAAKEHFRNGTKAFDLGHYAEAVKEYEAAYTAKDEPSLLFNIGQAYRLGGDNPNAVRSYKSYLRRVPNAPNRAAVETRIEELQKTIEQQQRAKEGPPEGTMVPPVVHEAPPPTVTLSQTAPPPPAPEKPPIYKRGWFWGVMAGVVVVGVGVGLGVGLGTARAPSFNPTVKDVGPAALVQF